MSDFDGMLAAKPADGAHDLSFIEELDESLWKMVIMVFDLGVYVVLHVPVIFRASGIALLFMFCWGLNVYGMDQAGVPFRTVLGLKSTDAKANEVFSLSGTLFGVLLVFLAMYRACHVMDFDAGQAAVSASYGMVLIWFATLSEMPAAKDARVFVKARATTFFTASEVKFIDVLFADALTSSSKLLADMNIIFCSVAMHALGAFAGGTCLNSYLGPVLASLPYVIRAVQCFNTYWTKNDQWQLVNFGKYISSLPVIWLSAIKSDLAELTSIEGKEFAAQLELLWLYSVVINTVYSFLWDVYMDWGLGRPRSSLGKPQWLCLRPVLAYQLPLYYYVIIVVDLALRGCWSLKMSSHLQHYGSQAGVFILIFEILEVLRRWAWIYFRVEWECISKKVPFITDVRSSIPSEIKAKITPRRLPESPARESSRTRDRSLLPPHEGSFVRDMGMLPT
eukprot:m.207222 g.207222  ORF g.207222 m.207222 type:complete len:450 (-) comp23635_c0_seq1:50-1399(-)